MERPRVCAATHARRGARPATASVDLQADNSVKEFLRIDDTAAASWRDVVMTTSCPAGHAVNDLGWSRFAMDATTNELRDHQSSHKSSRGWRPPGCDRIALVLQGGGALGAYQAGVYQALHEADIEPDWVSGVSIGAINSAIIAGNSRKRRLDRLRAFWDRRRSSSSRPSSPTCRRSRSCR
jgi:hypothetical protein